MKRKHIGFLVVAILIVIAIIVLSFLIFRRALAPAAPTAEATATWNVEPGASYIWSES